MFRPFTSISSERGHGEKDTRNLFIIAGIVLLPALGYQFFILMGGIGGLVDGYGYMLGRDFVNVWTAGRLTLEGRVDLLYDLDAYQAAQDTLLGHDLPFHNWSYPPLFLLFTIPFGALDYGAALALWSFSTLSLMLLAGRIGGLKLWQLAVLAFSPASVFNLWNGQNGFLTAALIMGGASLLEPRPVAAGVLFGLLAFKPHLGLLLPFALIASGSWRTLFSAAITVIALAALSIVLFGVAPWAAWFGKTAVFQKDMLNHGTGPFTIMMPTVVMAGRLLGLPLELAWSGWLVTFTVCIAFVIWAFRRSAKAKVSGCTAYDLRNAVLLASTILASPYGFTYDMTITASAVALVLRHPEVFSHSPAIRPCLFAVWILPAGLLALNSLSIPLGPFIMFAALFAIAWALSCEMRC
jgi:hypothetical protein